jgi:O-antigen/teichoic acid export membrane protein
MTSGKTLNEAARSAAGPDEVRRYRIARNTALNFLGYAIPLLVAVFTIPLVIHWLGKERFGILSLIWVVFGYFGIFDFGLGLSTTKFVAEALGKGETEKIPEYLWTAVIIQTVFGLIGTLILMLITPFLVQRILSIPAIFFSETRSAFYIMAVSLPFILVSVSLRGALEAARRFDLVNAVKVPSSIATYLAPLIGMVFDLKLPGIVLLLGASRILTLLVWAALCSKIIPGFRKRPVLHRQTISSLVRFGGWVSVSNVIGPVLTYLDRFLIGTLLSIEAVSYYTAPYEVITRLGIIPGSILMTLFPAFSTLKGRDGRTETRELFYRSVKYLLIVMGLILVTTTVLARVILKLWLGEGFARSSTPVFQILSVGFLASAMAYVPFGLLLGIGRADLPAKFQMIELCVYVPLLWVLIRAWGIVGAASAWAIRVWLDMTFLFIGAFRSGRIDFKGFSEEGILRILGLLAFFGAVGVGLGNLRLPWTPYGLLIVGVGFFLSLWLYGLDQADRDGLLRRIQALFASK